jgi:hypothetical protein
MDDIRQNLDKIDLCVGGMLVDSYIGTIGVLVEIEPDNHIAGYHYDSRFWKVFWISNDDNSFSFTGPLYMEEYGLKMSIAIGIYDYHSPTDDLKEEKI